MFQESLELDDLDYAIISELQQEGRRSFTDIASHLGVTSSTIKNRYLRLVNEGILEIQGYINPYKVGYKTHAVVLVKTKAGFVEMAAEKIAEFHEVDFVAITTGDSDLDITVSCRDHEHLIELINQKIHAVEGVLETKSTMILRVVKSRQGNIEHLRDAGVPQKHP